MYNKNYVSLWFFLLSIFAITNLGYAKDESAEAISNSPMIKIYESEEGKKNIANVAPTTNLIEFYKKGEWIKVGNPENGEVGWVHQKQYQEAIDAFNKPDIQMLFISKTMNSENKPQINITAYKNGQPISKEEADKLYHKFKEQEEERKNQWELFNHRVMKQSHGHFYRLFYQDPFFSSPLFLTY